MSTETFDGKFSSVYYKNLTSNIAMSSPKMSQIFYCHQEQWIQYFATARNIPDSMISYTPSTEKLRVIIKTGIPLKDDVEEVRFKNFSRNLLRSKMTKAEQAK